MESRKVVFKKTLVENLSDTRGVRIEKGTVAEVISRGCEFKDAVNYLELYIPTSRLTINLSFNESFVYTDQIH